MTRQAAQAVLFVVGPPGVGKTTLVRQLIEPDSHFIQRPKWTIGKEVCAAGHYMGTTFDGADTVPYNGAKECLEYWKQELSKKKLTIFDGDRFSNSNAVGFFHAEGFSDRLVCLHLTASDEALRARRVERGSNQNPTWLKGRVTKAHNFAESFGAGYGRRTLRLVADKPAEELAAALRKLLK